MSKKCKLIIKDQCNIKFEDLDAILRKRLVAALKYIDPNARHTHAFKLKRWDGKVPYFSIGGGSFYNMLPIILPMIIEEGYEIDIEDKRPQLDWVFPEITEDYLADKFWADDHPVMAGLPIMLREHQVRAANAFFQNWQSIGRLATSFGKTLLSATLSRVVEEVTGGRTIVIVPSKSLILQTEADYKTIDLDVGVYYGDRKELDRKHTICTWQSLSVLDKKAKEYDESFDIENFLKGVTCVMVDEVHGAAGKNLKGLLTGPFANIPIRWGFTGTIPKLDHQFAAVLSGIGPLVIEIASAELIEKGVLSECDTSILQMQVKDHIKKIDNWDSEKQSFLEWENEKKYTNSNPEILQWLSEFVQETTQQYGSSIILVENIATGKMLEKLIPNSVFVSGDTDAKDRKVEYKKIDNTKNTITIATFGVAAVGISITFLFNIFIFNSGRSFTRVMQSLGRILRKGKSEAVDMDKHTGNLFDVCTDLKWSSRHLAQRKSYYKEEGFRFTMNKIKIHD